jgi:conjugative relaxase-like TrwC/TraI family protein
MLSIHKISSADYYVDLAAASYGDYVSGDGEAPGRWLGQGLAEFAAAARAAGINVPHGVVIGETIDAEGAEFLNWVVSQESADTLFPWQRRPARTRKDRENRVKQAAQGKAGKAAGEYCAAFDMTFSAPKGFSICAEMTDDADVRQRLHGCHDRAVQRAVAYGEQVACWGREGTDGVEVVPGTGFVAAAFRHRTSRPPEKGAIPDPQTHTHVLVANHVQHPDGTWGALDGKAIFAWKMAAGAMYRTALLAEAEREGIHLPWTVTNAARGLVEVDMPADLLKATSRRRDQIVEAAERLGLTSQAGMRTATLATREAKMTDAAHAAEAALPAMLRARPELDDLSDEAKAVLAGVVAGDLPSRGQALRPLTEDELDSIAAELVSEARTWPTVGPGQHEPPPGHLTATESTFRHPQVVAALAWRAMGTGTSPEQIDAAATRLLESSEAVQLGGPAWQRRWTTREILLLEGRIIRMAEGGVGAGVGAVGDAIADATLNKNAWLSDEQATMVRHVITSGNAVDVVVGAAGSGKTKSLGPARAAWEAAGIPVLGCAHAARAAQGLEDDSGIRSSTMASLLLALHNEESEGLPAGCVVVVDETSMTDTRPVAELAAYVAAARDKLVLVGDHRQLQAVGAGGVYRALVEDKRITTVLLDNYRQKAEWDKAILAKLRQDEDGSGVREAVEAWTKHGRLHMHSDLCNHRLKRDARAG